MKILCVDGGRGEQFFVKPDNTLLRPGTAFYAPDWGPVASVEGVVVKIERPVKCLAAKFAHRTWTVWCRATEHRIEGIDPQKGRTFDRSFFVSQGYEPKDRLAGGECNAIDTAISNLSHYLSLKIGDLVFIPDSELK